MRSLAKNTEVQKRCAVQIIGFGIAGMGVAIAADRKGFLRSLCEQGVVYLDKRDAKQFDSLRFDILSNSPASDFLAGIRHDGEFKTIMENSNGQKLRCLGDRETPLTLVSDFFNDISMHLQEFMKRYPRSGFLDNTAISTLKIEENGEITSLDCGGKPLVTSRFVVMATGAIEKPNHQIIDFAKNINAQYCLSEGILRNQCDQQLQNAISTGSRIVVFGGAHSAFSVVDYILRQYGHRVHKKQITVAVRSHVNLYYDNFDDFHQYSQSREKYLIDFETQRINRYCGLRGVAKEMYQSIVAGKEYRVQLIQSENLLSKIKSAENVDNNYPASIVIQACGYTADIPAMIDHKQEEIVFSHKKGSMALSKNYNVCLEDTISKKSHRENFNKVNPIKQIFGAGLVGFIPSLSPYSITGEVPVGVNVYHQKDSAVIVDSIIQSLMGSIDFDDKKFYSKSLEKLASSDLC